MYLGQITLAKVHDELRLYIVFRANYTSNSHSRKFAPLFTPFYELRVKLFVHVNFFHLMHDNVQWKIDLGINTTIDGNVPTK